MLTSSDVLMCLQKPDQIEFDIPYRELGFYGVPNRGSVLLQPSVHCLVNLVEAPFFVMSMEEIEIACFERVTFGLRAFDMAFVKKDWRQPTIHITSISVDVLDSIKDWLDSINIKYYESSMSLNWKQVMASAREDPKQFWEEGGWDMVLADSDSASGSAEEPSDEADDGDNEDGKGEDGSEEDKKPKEKKEKKKEKKRKHDSEEEDDYKPSGSESEDYEYGGGSSDSDDDGDDDDEAEEEGEEPSDGEDWDELDRKAMEHDKRKAEKRRRDEMESDEDEDERPKAKRAKKQ